MAYTSPEARKAVVSSRLLDKLPKHPQSGTVMRPANLAIKEHGGFSVIHPWFCGTVPERKQSWIQRQKRECNHCIRVPVNPFPEWNMERGVTSSLESCKVYPGILGHCLRVLPVCVISRKVTEDVVHSFCPSISRYGACWTNQIAGRGEECIDFKGTLLSIQIISPHDVFRLLLLPISFCCCYGQCKNHLGQEHE